MSKSYPTFFKFVFRNPSQFFPNLTVFLITCSLEFFFFFFSFFFIENLTQNKLLTALANPSKLLSLVKAVYLLCNCSHLSQKHKG